MWICCDGIRNSEEAQESKTWVYPYPCDQCKYSATESGSLKKHKEANHLGVKYPCDQCEYVATHGGHLKKHKAAKHEGIRYPCGQCKYIATQIINLKIHRKAKNEGIRYPWDQCEYITAYAADLKKHKKAKHILFEYASKQIQQESVHVRTQERNGFQAVLRFYIFLLPFIFCFKSKIIFFFLFKSSI